MTIGIPCLLLKKFQGGHLGQLCIYAIQMGKSKGPTRDPPSHFWHFWSLPQGPPWAMSSASNTPGIMEISKNEYPEFTLSIFNTNKTETRPSAHCLGHLSTPGPLPHHGGGSQPLKWIPQAKGLHAINSQSWRRQKGWKLWPRLSHMLCSCP